MSKDITLHTNDPRNRRIVLHIKGAVETVVHVVPKVVRLLGNASEKIETVVKIIPDSKYPLSILSLKLKEGKSITANITPSRAPAGSWDVTVRSKEGMSGNFFDVITLKTDSNMQPEIKINVVGNIMD